MLWKRLSLTKKLFVVIAMTSTIIVLTMATMVGLNMRDGFARYLAQAEINRFDQLERALAEAHRSDQPGWPELSEARRDWAAFIGRHFRNRRPILQETRPRNQRLPPPRRGDPLRLSNRVTLLDANKMRVAGPPKRNVQLTTRAIMPVAAGEGAKPLGWIGLSPPDGAAAPADAVFLSGQSKSLVLASLFALVLSAFVAWFLARQFLAPIKIIALGANELASGNYAMRLPNTRSDELGDLTNNYNALAASLEAAASSERRWITNTSHELQTPLAILRAEIEALQDNVRQPTVEILAGLHASVMRLSHLVGDINTLSRTREGGFSLTIEPCDLDEVIRSAIDHARLGITEAGLSIVVDFQPDLVVHCDRNRITQLIDNLLENARRYTASPGKVCILTHSDDGFVSVIVEDSAPCPPQEMLDRLSERFFRVEESRSRAHGGAGLGLSICEAIAEAHGGSLHFSESSLGGLRIEVRLPMASPKVISRPTDGGK